jgi:RNA polymerase sigma factor (sigma-70 family)
MPISGNASPRATGTPRQKCAAGWDAAFALYGLRHLRSASAADDLVQQILLKMLEALRAGRLRLRDKLAPFVLGICRMTVLHLRRSARRQERLLAEFGADLVPDQQLMPRLDRDQLTRCVRTLNERERTIVVLMFYDEQTAAPHVRRNPDDEVRARPTVGTHPGCVRCASRL